MDAQVAGCLSAMLIMMGQKAQGMAAHMQALLFEVTKSNRGFPIQGTGV